MVVIGDGSLEKSLVNDLRPIEIESFGQCVDTEVARVPLVDFRYGMFVIDAILLAYEGLSVLIRIGTCERTLFPVLVVERERLVELLVGIGVTPPAVAVAIPKDAVVPHATGLQVVFLSPLLRHLLVKGGV